MKVVRDVYDESCEVLLTLLKRGLQGIRPDPLHSAYASLDESAADVVRQIALFAIDRTFARFLSFFDEHEIPIEVLNKNGRKVNITAASDGLAAEPYTDDGWIERYSRYKDGLPNPRGRGA